MEELLEIHKIKIEQELYKEVMLLIESEYNSEGVINPNKKSSTRIIYKDKKLAIKKVADAIKRFSEANNLNIDIVKDYLLKTIENEKRTNNLFEEEYNQAEEIVQTQTDDREEK